MPELDPYWKERIHLPVFMGPKNHYEGPHGPPHFTSGPIFAGPAHHLAGWWELNPATENRITTRLYPCKDQGQLSVERPFLATDIISGSNDTHEDGYAVVVNRGNLITVGNTVKLEDPDQYDYDIWTRDAPLPGRYG